MTAFSAANRAWIEDLYARYLESPSSVDPTWREEFDRWRDDSIDVDAVRPPEPVRRSIFGGRVAGDATGRLKQQEKTTAVQQLIEAYRRDGHLAASLDPLGLRARRDLPQLTLAYHGLGEADLDTTFSTGTLAGPAFLPLREIIEHLEATYCGPLGSEYMYVRDVVRRRWLMRRIEETRGRIDLDRVTALRVLEKLTAADHFESFINTKYLGKKRFSVEGGEAVIPLLDLMLSTLADLGVEAAVLGMAHRGRLNVLANILGKAHGDIFEEFEDGSWTRPDDKLSGDVKYHLGYTADVGTLGGGRINVSLAFNPSHLEFVAPVVEGHVRGRQDHFGDAQHQRTASILLHGDAAIIGQGVTSETINMSRLPGYANGGTIHVVINNQVGFTTPVESSRSSEHCTDVVKVMLMPVLHVNAEDLGAVAFAARVAAEYRQVFGEDIVIDLWCYRKYGHNEADEPAYTNPVMYRTIRQKKAPLPAFVDRAIELGVLTHADAAAASDAFRALLDQEFQRARDPARQKKELGGLWKGIARAAATAPTVRPTAVPVDRLQALLTAASTVPEHVRANPKVMRGVLDKRVDMARGDTPLDWGAAETLAFATLVTEGHPVRVSGQDSGRGTFSHRHAVVHDQEDGSAWVPLDHLDPRQARFTVYDSPLSETAVLGFEFGYSLARPDALVVWEAQFGDFANGAQVIIDQFICSSEAKWNQACGLVLLLPHGYEGQGPEHSSARLERFLQLSGQDNWRVVNLTTPAQVFHALRQQLHRSFRKPLVVMSPKSLLRHKLAVSTLQDLATGGFQPVIGDPDLPPGVRRVVLCSGKVYYDLAQARQERSEQRVALVRIEQLYPLDERALDDALAPYDGAEIVFCQEEPANMGAWPDLAPQLVARLGRVTYVGRPRAAAPATGSKALHDEEQDRLVAQALDLPG